MSRTQPAKPDQELPLAPLTQMIFGFMPARAIAIAAKIGIATLV